MLSFHLEVIPELLLDIYNWILERPQEIVNTISTPQKTFMLVCFDEFTISFWSMAFRALNTYSNRLLYIWLWFFLRESIKLSFELRCYFGNITLKKKTGRKILDTSDHLWYYEALKPPSTQMWKVMFLINLQLQLSLLFVQFLNHCRSRSHLDDNQEAVWRKKKILSSWFSVTAVYMQ